MCIYALECIVYTTSGSQLIMAHSNVDYINHLGNEIYSIIWYVDIIDCVEYLVKLIFKIKEHDRLLDENESQYINYRNDKRWMIPKLEERIEELEPEWYAKTKIVTSEKEIVNGYALNDSRWRSEPCYGIYVRLKTAWEEEMDMTHEEFVEEFEKEACTDWNKMDEHGESFGGFWKSEDPKIRDKAFTLQRTHNREKLWELPFPKRFLLITMDYGCACREESVRDSNHFGVWFERKMAAERLVRLRTSGLNEDIWNMISSYLL